MTGIKHDGAKLRYDLVPPKALLWLATVLTFGAKKYAPDNWRTVPEARTRYYAALMRHIESWRMGEFLDEETGYPHLAHALCCLVFLLELHGEPPAPPAPERLGSPPV